MVPCDAAGGPQCIQLRAFQGSGRGMVDNMTAVKSLLKSF